MTPITVPAPPSDLIEPQLSENAVIVLRRRYLHRQDGATVETPKEMLWRVARAVAEAERQHGGDVEVAARRFYEAMARLEFLPASPTLMNAGRELGQLSACFVLPLDDSLESIFTTLKHAALVHQSGGGTGFDLSRIRPAGDVVKSTDGVASGPLSFLRIFNAATEEIKQGGTRRGANMGILRVDHPDILEFIDAKQHTGQLTNFNLSVAVTDDFMDALARGAEYALISPRTGKTTGSLAARKVWERICESAWRSGEPGLFFVDRANDLNPVAHAETMAATNPCGELPLAPYDSCNLGSVSLDRHVRHTTDGHAEIDWDHLERTVRLAVRFLDDVVSVNRYPVAEIRDKTLANRRIGLGVMGFARLLFRLGVPYDSEEGRQVADQVMSFLKARAHDESRCIADERGVFPTWEGSIWQRQGVPMRNAAVTTVAPTGTLSMIADTSGGCEPEYSLVYVKRVLDGTAFPYVVPQVEEIARREGWWRESLIDEIAANRGSIEGIPDVPERWQRVFATAYTVPPEDHVRMQAVFQKHVDNAVSKTINLRKNAKPDDVDKAYRLAYSLGCKGITVYRAGSRPDQVLDLHDPDAPTGALPEDVPCNVCDAVPAPDEPQHKAVHPRTSRMPTARSAAKAHRQVATATQADPAPPVPRPRPLVTRGATHKISTGCGELYVTVGEDEVGPVEVIAVRSRANACTSAHLEASSRLASLALRMGVPLEEVAKALLGVRCADPIIAPHGIVLGCVDGIGQALARQALGPDGPQHDVLPHRPLEDYDEALRIALARLGDRRGRLT